MSNVLILGATGLLGMALVEHYADRNYSVGALSRKSVKYKKTNIRSYDIDILCDLKLDKIISKYDIIINCIGQITRPINQCFLLNSIGMRNILLAVKKHDKKLIHVSSVSVYGEAKYVNEESKLNPQTPYATIKCYAEFLIKEYLRDYIILRVSNLYGHGQQKGIISYLTNSYMLGNKGLTFNNDGELRRYYLNISDFIEVIFATSNMNQHGIYNVISKDEYTIKELIRLYQTILNYQFDVQYSSAPAIENINEIDNRKLNQLLTFNCKTTMKGYIKSIRK